VNSRIVAWAIGLAALIALPFLYRDPYHLHLLVLILIWSFAYTSWSIMGPVSASASPGTISCW
jgi:branched-chain amino acid transport system permease protein